MNPQHQRAMAYIRRHGGSVSVDQFYREMEGDDLLLLTSMTTVGLVRVDEDDRIRIVPDLLDWLRRNWRQDGPKMKQLCGYWCRRERRMIVWPG